MKTTRRLCRSRHIWRACPEPSISAPPSLLQFIVFSSKAGPASTKLTDQSTYLRAASLDCGAHVQKAAPW
jgi:hypothetical protein